MVKIKQLVVKLWKSLVKVFCQEFSGTDGHSQERGSVVMLVALSLTALLGLCAIVADVGSLYAQKIHLQNSVDAAALACVRELPDLGKARAIAIEYANKNGVVVVPEDVNVDLNNDSKIIVTAYKQVPTHFARFWGITEEPISISASSRAIMVPPKVLYGAVPLSIQEQHFDNTKEYVLKSGGRDDNSDLYLNDQKNNAIKKSVEEPVESSATPGWYGALELSDTGDDNGAVMYRKYLAEGYPENLSVGQIVDVKHGNMSGPTVDGIKLRIDQIVHVPIVKVIPDSGNSIQKVQIVGFAAFFLSGVPGMGNDSDVKGWFIGTMPTIGQSNDFGFSTPKLVAN